MNNKERETLAFVLSEMNKFDLWELDSLIKYLIDDLNDEKLNNLYNEKLKFEEYRTNVMEEIRDRSIKQWHLENPKENYHNWRISKSYSKGDYFQKVIGVMLKELKEIDTDDSLIKYDYIKDNLKRKELK